MKIICGLEFSKSVLICSILAALGLCCGAPASHGGGFSHGAQTLGCGSCNYGTQPQSPRGTWNLPGPGIELVSRTLAVRFLSTIPPGKYSLDLIFHQIFNYCK